MKQVMSNVTLVRRDDMPSMKTVTVNGVEHWLGHVKDFTKDKALVNFLPKDNRVSIAWVRLEAGEQLDEHIHPVDSMILICEGGARTLGGIQEIMNEGDILLVPQGQPHGFIGLSPNGFWGLSLQFDSRGLYENISDPWATFTNEDKIFAMNERDTANQLFRKNEEYMERFDKHRLFALVRNGLLDSVEAKGKFLDCFQVWSNYFQKMVLARVMTIQHPIFEDLAWQHLMEELGHNRDLAKNREGIRSVFDPVLEASCAWFTWKMGMINDASKVVLSHLVVEASATFFYKHISPAISASTVGNHFSCHQGLDDGHVEMGYAFLRKLPFDCDQQLFEIQHQGWSMLTTIMGRIADLVLRYPEVANDAKNIQDNKGSHNDILVV